MADIAGATPREADLLHQITASRELASSFWSEKDHLIGNPTGRCASRQLTKEFMVLRQNGHLLIFKISLHVFGSSLQGGSRHVNNVPTAHGFPFNTEDHPRFASQ
jgi:hypothetical protein